MTRQKEQVKLQQLVSEAITTLCKATIRYETKFYIRGSIEIAVDEEKELSILLNLNEAVIKSHENDYSPQPESSQSQRNDKHFARTTVFNDIPASKQSSPSGDDRDNNSGDPSYNPLISPVNIIGPSAEIEEVAGLDMIKPGTGVRGCKEFPTYNL